MRLLSGASTNGAAKKSEDKQSKRKRRDEDPGIPPELLLRRDHNIRYERNGAVYATDGKVGTLKKVVVDDAAGEVEALVIAVDVSDRLVLIPPDLVDKTAGSAVFLVVNRAQFTERLANASDFDKRQYTRVDLKSLLKRERPASAAHPRRAVSNVGKDFVETPNVSPLSRLQRRSGTLAAD